MTMGNTVITVVFGVIAAAQLAVGVILTAERESKLSSRLGRTMSNSVSMRFTAVARV